LALSFAAGYVYSGSGWHNGPAFLLMFVMMLLLCRTSSGIGSMDAARLLGPMLFAVGLSAVLSIAGVACGIAAAGRDTVLGGMPFYAAALLFGGLVIAAVNVYIASRDREEMILGPVFVKTAVFFAVFIAGLVTVAYDAGPRVYVAAGYAVFCTAVSVIFLWRSTLAAYT